MKKFSKIAIVAVLVAAFALTGCASKKKDAKDNTDVTVDAGDTTEANDGASGDASATSGAKTVKGIYMDFVPQIETFAPTIEGAQESYLSYDYMVYDYDKDGDIEMILYLGYNDSEDTYRRDMFYMDCDVESGEVYVVDSFLNVPNDTMFYAEHEGELCYYYWNDGNIYWSELDQVVNVEEEKEDGTTERKVVLEKIKEYDYLITDLEKEKVAPCPLYGNWEISPFLD